MKLLLSIIAAALIALTELCAVFGFDLPKARTNKCAGYNFKI